VSFDGAGNMYIADFGSTTNGSGAQVVEIPAGGGNAVVVSANAGGTALDGAADVQIDGAGDIFIADQDNSRVVELPVGGALTALTPTVNGKLLGYANDALPSPGGILYITEKDNNRLIEMQGLGTGTATQVTSVDGMNLNDPGGLALDSAGDLFIADQYNNRVAEVLAGGGSGSVYGPSIPGVSGDLSDAYGVLVDAASNLFITDFTGTGRLIEIPAGTSTGSVLAPTVSGTTLTSPSYLGTDDAGNLYIADYGSARVFKIARTAQVPTPMLAVTTSSSGTFTQGSTGQWNVTVINEEPDSATSGTVTVSDTLPTGSTLSSYSGSGWSCSGSSTVTCTSTASVIGGNTYAQIQLIVNVPPNSATSVTNNVVAYGGGDTTHTNSSNGATSFSTITVVQVAASITISAGNNQSALINTAFSSALSATVLDAGSNPIVGASVTFSAPSSGASGTFAGSSTYATTSAAGGLATSGAFTANSTPGGYSVEVSAGSADANVSLTNSYTPVATSFQFSSVPSSSYVGQAVSITVSAYDQLGNSDTGYSGTVNITSSDANAVFSSPVSFVSGTASFNVTFLTAGSQTITVTDTSNTALTATTAGITISIPVLVVNQTTDDAGSASNCAVQTAAGTTTNADSCSLRDALLDAAALGSASISFDSTAFASAQTITLSNGVLNIPSYTSIWGATSGSGATLTNLVTVNGNQASTDFYVDYGVSSTSINNLIVTGASCDPNTGITGGGISNQGSLTVAGSTISGNVARSGLFCSIGGGINNGGTLTVTNSTISGNAAGRWAGGIFAGSGSAMTVTNSTISGNSSAYGGGIYEGISATLTVTNSTISANSATSDPNAGGGIFNENGVPNLANTIVAANSGGDVFSTYTDNGGNQVGTGVALSVLGSYGGPTQTMLPLPGAAAICGGLQSAIASGVTTDQRGFANTNAIYPGYNPGAPCVDSGAVQTNYAIGFSTEPATAYTNLPMSPAPVVSITESNMPANAVTSTLQIGDTASDLGGTTTASFSAGAAAFSNLLFASTAGSDQLTATLSLNAALGTPLTLTTQSTGFQVDAPTAATMIAPTNGSTFTGTSATFTWTSSGANGYYLLIGTQGVGSKNIYNSAEKPASTTSYTFNSLPLTGATIYVRLTSILNGTWVSHDYQFTAASLAAITSPANSSSLSGTSATFTWSASTAAGVSGYYLWIGTQGVGSNDVYNSALKSASTTSYTFTRLPITGVPIYVRLITNINGVWAHNDYQYTAGSPATMTAPTTLSTLPGSSATFTWTAGGGATGYYLWIGTQGVGSNDLYNSAEKAANVTSYTFSQLPAAGQTIYVRLITNFNGVSEHNDYQYTAATGAILTLPTPNSTFTGPSATFTWTAAANTNGYYLWIGSQGVGSNDIYNSAEKTGTSYTFNNLPTNGGTIYVRLYTGYSGTWTYNDYQFTAAE
jgi:hypothetical protein